MRIVLISLKKNMCPIAWKEVNFADMLLVGHPSYT